MRGGKIRIEIESGLEAIKSLRGLVADNGEIAECHVRPRIVVVQFNRATRKISGISPITTAGGPSLVG